MQNSNAAAYLSSWVILASFLAGCSLPSAQKNQASGDSASFVVQSLEGEVTETKVIAGFSVPASKSFSFTACVVDLKQARPLLNHKFQVRGADQEQEIVTDGKGCLHWSEELAYNHFAEAKYVRLDRGLRAIGMQKGERTLHLAVNPWEDKVFDLEKKKVENLASLEKTEVTLSGTESSNTKSLMVADLQVFVQDRDLSNSGNSYRMEVRGQPNLQFKKSSKEDVYESLTSGKFQVRFRIGSVSTENSVEKKKLLVSSDWITTESVRGQIAVPFEFQLDQSCGRGNYVLGLEIKPILPANYKLKTSEALYMLSTCDSLSGRVPAVLSSQSSSDKVSTLSLNDYFANSTTTTIKTDVAESAASASAPAKQNPPIKIENNFQKAGLFLKDFRTQMVDNIGSSPFDRKVNLELTACLTTAADGKAFKAQKITVTKMTGQKESMMTLPDGCLHWDDSLSFKIQGQECEQKSQIVLDHENLNLHLEIPILVNPWAKVVRNGYTNPDVINRAPVCSGGKSYLMSNQFEFKNSKYSYAIDSMLNLTIQRTGTFQMSLALYRPSISAEESISGAAAPNGQYSLSFALLKEDADVLNPKASDILMMHQKNVEIQGLGTISEELMLEADNLKEIGSASQVLLLIKPLNLSENFKPKLMKGIFVNSNIFESGPLTFVKEAEGKDLDVLFAQYSKLKAEHTQSQLELSRKLGTKSQLKAEMNLTQIDLNNESLSLGFRDSIMNPLKFVDPRFGTEYPAAPLANDQLKTWLQNESIPAAMAERLCIYWFFDHLQRPLARTKLSPIVNQRGYLSALVSQCRSETRKNLGQFFDVQVRSFIKNPTKLSEESSASDYSISQSFNLGRAHVESDSTTNSWDYNGSINLKFLSVLGVGGGVRHQVATTDQTAKQEASANSFANQINTTIENVTLKIRAEQSEKCMVIKVRPEVWNQKYFSQIFRKENTKEETIQSARSGLLICDGVLSNQPKEFTENYWIMNQNMRGSQATSPQSSKTRKFIAVRGDSDFLSLMTQITDVYNLPESFKNQFIGRSFTAENTKNFYLKDMPGSPGQIIHSRNLSR